MSHVIVTDFYFYNDDLFYVAIDPLEPHNFYRIWITTKHPPLSYNHMCQHSIEKEKAFLDKIKPLGIGWVPVDYRFFDNHPEYLI